MKFYQKLISLTLIAVFILVPLATMNTTPDEVSAADNRKLAERPPLDIEHMSAWIDYFNDRIGFRDQAIRGYMGLNQALFNKFGQPGYHWGANSEVFGTDSRSYNEEFLTHMADQIKSMQDYCQQRNVPFYYVLAPFKTEVYGEYEAAGYSRGKSVVATQLVRLLEERHVNFIDLQPEMLKRKAEGIRVFNKQWEINHWTPLGAFYGANRVLEQVQEKLPDVKPISLDDYNQTVEHKTRFNGTGATVDDYQSNLSLKNPQDMQSVPTYVEDMRIDSQHRYRKHFFTDANNQERALFIHGSYYIGSHSFFLPRGFKEVFAIHNYENAINMDYYFNIAHPTVVLFTGVAYSINSSYYDDALLGQVSYNLPLTQPQKESALPGDGNTTGGSVQLLSRNTTNGLTRLCVPAESVPTQNLKSAWLATEDYTYDLRKREWGYELYDFNSGGQMTPPSKDKECLMADIRTDEYQGAADFSLYLQDATGTFREYNLTKTPMD